MILDSLTDVNGKFPLFLSVFDEGAAVARVGANGLQARKFLALQTSIQRHTATDCIVLIRRVDVREPKIALRIDETLPTAPFDFFAAVKTAFFSLVVRLHALRIQNQKARRFLTPPFCRTSFTKR